MRVRTAGSYDGHGLAGMTVVVTSSTAPDIAVGTVGTVTFLSTEFKRVRVSVGPHSDDFQGAGVDAKIFRPRA